jgi:hypothetical protein
LYRIINEIGKKWYIFSPKIKYLLVLIKMRKDIKLKKYKMDYKKINDLYCNNFMSITRACKKIGISPKTYQNMCKELGKPSVAKELPSKKTSDTKTTSSETPFQRGGHNGNDGLDGSKKGENIGNIPVGITRIQKRNDIFEEQIDGTNEQDAEKRRRALLRKKKYDESKEIILNYGGNG